MSVFRFLVGHGFSIFTQKYVWEKREQIWHLSIKNQARRNEKKSGEGGAGSLLKNVDQLG